MVTPSPLVDDPRVVARDLLVVQGLSEPRVTAEFDAAVQRDLHPGVRTFDNLEDEVVARHGPILSHPAGSVLPEISADYTEFSFSTFPHCAGGSGGFQGGHNCRRVTISGWLVPGADPSGAGLTLVRRERRRLR